MTPRERVAASIEFRRPDRLPHRHCVLPAAWPVFPGLPALYRRFPSDFSDEAGLPPPELPRCFRAGTYVDEWGCTWTVPNDGFLGRVTCFPLADPAMWTGFRPPDPPTPDPGERRRIAATRGERYCCLGWITTFERLVDLCGFENLLVALHERDGRLVGLLDRVVAHNLAWVEGLLTSRPDAIFFADDWGTQQATMISPLLWRQLFLPAYRRMFAAASAGGAHVFFHSDGVTAELLPDLVAAGVRVFWVDLTINPRLALAGLRGKVCFQLLTDVQFVLRSGTPDQVRQHVRDMVGLLGTPDGGVILCHEVHPDQPWENIVACLEAFHEAQGRCL